MFLKLLKFVRDCEHGSNHWKTIDNSICDFELFLADISSGSVQVEIVNGQSKTLTLEDILFFFAGVQKLPLFGLQRPIEIYFDETLTLPKVSTCGLTVILPTKSGFGVV